MSLLSRLLSRTRPAPVSPFSDEEEDGGAEAAPDEPPDWAVELLDAVQKLARSQARAAARVEALESKVEGGFAEMRSAVAAPRPSAAPVARLDVLLDALDVLDEARRAIAAAGSAQTERGLAGVSERLESFLADSGVSRRAEATEPLDGRLFRVVGTVELPDLPDGVPAQVVRAAALSSGRVVREGEVLINRRSSTS